MRWSVTLVSLFVTAFALGYESLADESFGDKSLAKRPAGLAILEPGKKLLVALEGNGSLAIVDLQKNLVREVPLGKSLSDVAVGKSRVAVVDEAAGELVVLSRSLQPLQRIKIGMTPVSVRLHDGDRLVSVACLWPRRVALVEIEKGHVTQIDLPFTPRKQLAVDDRLIVADAFGGKLAIIDLKVRRLISIRTLPGHQIAGLSVTPERDAVWITHQVLFPQGRTTQGEIITNNVISNNLRRVPLGDLFDPRADQLREDRSYLLGDIELGAGDPAEVGVSNQGLIAVAIAGTNEVHLGHPETATWTRLDVGARPRSLVIDGSQAYVLNQLDDTLSSLDLEALKVVRTIALGKPRILSASERGERLFFNARLAHASWYSCQSCHVGGHASGGLNDNFSDGSFGTPKRVLSLLGAGETGPWAWQGHVAQLEDQMKSSVKSTMQGKTPTPEQVRELAEFVRTLPPAPGLSVARGNSDTETSLRGRKVFARNKCGSCHSPGLFTSAKAYDVGLRDEAGNKTFNPPSLRGVSQGGPYFHDGRATSLEDVFRRHRHELAQPLSDEDLRDLVSLLQGL